MKFLKNLELKSTPSETLICLAIAELVLQSLPKVPRPAPLMTLLNLSSRVDVLASPKTPLLFLRVFFHTSKEPISK